MDNAQYHVNYRLIEFIVQTYVGRSKNPKEDILTALESRFDINHRGRELLKPVIDNFLEDNGWID